MTAPRKCTVAVGHSILEGAYFIIRDKVPHLELGADYLNEINKQHVIRHHVRRLESLGLKVDIQELALAA